MEEEFFNFLELLVPSLKVLWATFEHVEMEHEFDLIGVQVKTKFDLVRIEVSMNLI
jgi:hypothetical protein